jgi:peptidoglycan/LPS O-acetylase OafA/YrhL
MGQKIDSINYIATEQSSQIRLSYLDGLRGLAALYVVLFHIYQECSTMGDLSPWLMKIVRFIGEGEIAVSVFIVLSGYCLMLPVVRSGKNKIQGGIINYLKRRSRRILPPYYAALFLSLLLLVLTLGWQYLSDWQWNNNSFGFQPGTIPSWGAILSHLLLIHNLSQNWAFTINAPMWSVATEWQIYFLFPALLLPLYRRFGIICVAAIAFIIGLVPGYFWSQWPTFTACPWFLGLFALGMVAASINFSENFSLVYFSKRIPWGILTTILWSGVIAKIIFFPGPAPIGISKALSCLAGVATACSIVYCTQAMIDRKSSPLILQILETRLAVGLGEFSYSLYLIHALVIVLVHQFLLRSNLSPTYTFLTLLIIALPIAILAAYIFHLYLEKPFMSAHSHKRKFV